MCKNYIHTCYTYMDTNAHHPRTKPNESPRGSLGDSRGGQREFRLGHWATIYCDDWGIVYGSLIPT